jgi:ABC-2 type transport system ATP-binding protein
MSGGQIVVESLTKVYKKLVAVDHLSFTVEPGRVTGFLGPNGAGKTTTLRMVLNLVRPTAGTATIGGRRYADLHDPVRQVGAILEASGAHRGRSGRNHLRMLCDAAGIPVGRADTVLDMVHLTAAADRKFKGYSLGMRQRLGIAAALLGDPPVLVLDEPFNGMDPDAIIWMRALLRSLAADGRAVLVSSHLMGELQDTADHLVVAGRGRALADAPVADLIEAASSENRVALRTTAPADARAVLVAVGASVNITGAETMVVAGVPAEQVVTLLGDRGVPLTEVTAHRATLEDVYVALTRDAVEFRPADSAERSS